MVVNADDAKNLIEVLGKLPDKAERFVIGPNSVDILVFEDRPFQGVHSAITNGVSNFEGVNNELIAIYDPKTLTSDTDLNGFIATYLELYFLSVQPKVNSGDLFIRRNSVLNGYNFSGIYLTNPSYFPNGTLSVIRGVEYLWMLLLFDSEVDYVVDHGRDKFEDLLEDLDPDLSDFGRRSLL